MSFEDQIDHDDAAEGTSAGGASAAIGAGPSDAADDEGQGLASTLGGGDMEFVVEAKKPFNRGTLVLFGLVLAGIAGTYFMMMRSGPKSAVANAEAAAANQTITQFLSSGDQSMKAMEKMLRETEQVVQQFLDYPSLNQVPLSALQTNPFRHVQAKAPGVDADAEEAASRKRREEERVAIVQAVQGLQLQSVMHGDARRSCMINNTLYAEGQQVEGFTIEKISPNAVIVKHGVYRFELRMQR